MVFSAPLLDRLEVGRQRVNELEPYHINRAVNPPRLIVAPIRELEISRAHVSLHLQGDHLRVKNISSQATIELKSPTTGQTFHLTDEDFIVLPLPLRFSIGNCSVSVRPAQTRLVGLDQMTVPPAIAGHSLTQTFDSRSLQQLRDKSRMDISELMSWLRCVLNLFQGTPNNDGFFQQAATAMTEMLKLDLAAVLFTENKKWQIRSLHGSHHQDSPNPWSPSLPLLNQVESSMRAHRQIPTIDRLPEPFLEETKCLVAAPILSTKGTVIGAMYGEKIIDQQNEKKEITEVETMFVELLASGIAAGLARLQHEKKAVEARVRLEQFFPAHLVDKLENDKEFLKGRESEVTVLFCDIRKFSEISERVGPEVTVDFINDVMQQLSVCVQNNGGVLVDYIGDELIAMWGAPDSQPAHASLATTAARAMLAQVPSLCKRWETTIGQAFQIGIGINSGLAQVGNVGSQLRFKYGPLGNTVNVASRVQGVTKQVGVPLVVTLETAKRLSCETPYRTLCQVKLVNVMQPVTICELRRPGSDWLRLKQNYEEGLRIFLSGDYRSACTLLSAVLNDFPEDQPARMLLNRAREMEAGEVHYGQPGIWEIGVK